MSNTVNTLKPSVCFEIQKIIGISTNGGNCKTYQVQWAPSWISGLHLVGCEGLIEQFEHGHREEHIKIEEIDTNHSQDICGLADGKDNEVVVVQGDNLHDDSASKEKIKKDIQDNIDINTNSSSQSSIHHNKSNIDLKVSSLNSIIQNVTGSNSEHYVGRNTVHPDFQAMKTNICNVRNERSPQSNVQVDNKRQEAGDVSGDSVEAMVVVTEASDCGPTESSQLKPVQYFSGGNNRDVAMSTSFENSMRKTSSEKKRDVNINVNLLTKGGESSRSCETKQGDNSLDTKSEARKTFLVLKNHSKIYKGIHQCATCCKTFTAKIMLQQHELVHSVDKEFSCNFCKEKFTDMGRLLVHLQLHKTVKENPLECSYCPKIFSRITHLEAHTRIHTGECPFKCNVCHRRFNVKYSLQRHFKTHHVKEGL